MITLFKAGTRTYILSILALVCALLLQAHTQGLITLNPMLKMSFTFGLTIVLPMIPLFLRKAIDSMKRELADDD